MSEITFQRGTERFLFEKDVPVQIIQQNVGKHIGIFYYTENSIESMSQEKFDEKEAYRILLQSVLTTFIASDILYRKIDGAKSVIVVKL